MWWRIKSFLADILLLIDETDFPAWFILVPIILSILFCGGVVALVLIWIL
jgi:hypothetical protein